MLCFNYPFLGVLQLTTHYSMQECAKYKTTNHYKTISQVHSDVQRLSYQVSLSQLLFCHRAIATVVSEII